MCHDFVSLAQVEVFYFSPKSDAFGAKKQNYTIHSQEKEKVLHYILTIPDVCVLLELEMLSQNCFT